MIINIDKQKYLELIEDDAVCAVDVRTEAECNEFRYPKSLVGYDWLSGEFYDKVDTLDSSKPIILMCRSGNRSMQASLYLETNGFETIYNLEGGQLKW